jgi:hypothetical protein
MLVSPHGRIVHTAVKLSAPCFLRAYSVLRTNGILKKGGEAFSSASATLQIFNHRHAAAVPFGFRSIILTPNNEPIPQDDVKIVEDNTTETDDDDFGRTKKSDDQDDDSKVAK